MSNTLFATHSHLIISIQGFQFLEEPIQRGNIEEPDLDQTMRDSPDMDDELSRLGDQIFPQLQLDAAYNFQRDPNILIFSDIQL